MELDRHDYFALAVDADLTPPLDAADMSRPVPERMAWGAHLMHDDSCIDPRGILQCSHVTRSFSRQGGSSDFLPPALSGGGKAGGQCDGDDCASQISCTSMCLASCPSQCGEAGQGTYCDDDACADQGQCADAGCEEACLPCQPCQPCTDLKCSSLDAFDPFASASPVISDGDKQAAAALASFGDHMEPDAAFFLDPIQHPSAPDLSTLPGGHFGLAAFPDSFFETMSSQAVSLSARGWTSADNFLASHILEYHHPIRNGMQGRSCPVDHGDFQLSRCTLPKALNGVNLSGENFTHHLDGHPCGYEVNDLDQFAYHLFADHLPFQLCDESADGSRLSCPSTFLATDTSPPQFLGLDAGQTAMLQPQSPFPTAGQQVSSSASSVPAWSADSPTSPPSSRTSPPMLALERWSVEPAQKGLVESGEPLVCRWRVGEGDEICGKIFDSAVKLHTHGKQVHTSVLHKDEAGFHCCWSGCVRSNTFTQRSKLDRHLQTHTGFKPVQCTVCKEYFSAKQALIQHMRVHTGEQPWKCRHPGCTRTFKQQSALTMHERTHTGERPLQCDICGKTFGESSNLSKHRRTHNARGNYVCTICHKDFNRHDQLRRHATRKHGLSHPGEVERMMSRPRGARQNSSVPAPG